MGNAGKALVGALIMLWSTKAAADELQYTTPSGMTEALFPGGAQETSDLLANQCINLKFTVVSSAANSVVCEMPMNFGQSVMGRLLMGNSYSTPPRQFVRFALAELGGRARVQASGWMELQMAFGQTRRTDFAGPTFHNPVMGFLLASGGEPPAGTTFTNHAWIGVEPTGSSISDAGYRVGSIAPGSPAEAAGLQVGDVITRIGRERIKSQSDVLDGLAQGAKAKSYPIEVMRDSGKATLTVQTQFRPPAGEPVWPELRPVVAAADVTTAVSVADELGKFAKLRDDGVITPAEFDAQKQRLLAK